MKILVALIAVLSLFFGATSFLSAKSAIHEILGAILILCFVVSAVGLAILGALEDLKGGTVSKPAAPAEKKPVLTAAGRKPVY